VLGQSSNGTISSLVGQLTSVTVPSVGSNATAADEVAAALSEITEASGGVEGRDDPEVMVGGDASHQQQQQQVFTVDTGLGNTDVTGMPTLADANLAETAAKLQKVGCSYVRINEPIIIGSFCLFLSGVLLCTL